METDSQGTRGWEIFVALLKNKEVSLSSPYCPNHVNRVRKLHEAQTDRQGRDSVHFTSILPLL